MPEIFASIGIPEPHAGFAWVYIVQSVDGALYIGHTRNVAERMRKHRYGMGSKFTKDHAAHRLVFCEGPFLSNDAVAREFQLKRWSRAKKEALIRGDFPALRNLSQSRKGHA